MEFESRFAGRPSAGAEMPAPSGAVYASLEQEERSMAKEFLTDLKTIRARARKHMEKGAVTEGYRGDLKTILRLLNEGLASELVCVLRYKRHYFMATGIDAQSVAAEFLQHANEEQGHADQIAARIVQLGGAPNFSPEGMLTRSHSEYVEGGDLREMIREDLVAERIAVDSYGEMIRYIADKDPTTRRMLEGILAMEEEHADDLANLLTRLGDAGGKRKK
jgi:bacterioferritin